MTRRVHDAPGSYHVGPKPCILLDTCVVVWLASGQHQRIGPQARHAMERHRWAVSALTPYEIALKVAIGKLKISATGSATTWWQHQLEHFQFKEIPFTSAMALTAGGLPPHHRDPFDRGIIATAHTEGILLCSPDPEIAAYQGMIGVIW